MSDPRVRRLARVIGEYSIGIEPGQLVLIEAPALAEPLVIELARCALDLGAHPRVRLTTEGAQRAYLSAAGDELLRKLLPSAMPEIEAVDVRIAVTAAWNTRELSGIDPAKVAIAQEARKPVMDVYMRRSAAGELHWCVTAFPCAAYAQDADMSLAAYEDFVYRAGWLHLEDPVSAWRAFAGKLEQITARLSDVRTLRVLAEDTDLTVGVAGRRWVQLQRPPQLPRRRGVHRPDRDRDQRHVRFSFPAVYAAARSMTCGCGSRAGAWSSEAAAGEGLTSSDARRSTTAPPVLGEFAIGTNYAVDRFTQQILFDEKIGGTCHMAVGAGYPETGSTNLGAALGHGLRPAKAVARSRPTARRSTATAISCPSSRPTCRRRASRTSAQADANPAAVRCHVCVLSNRGWRRST